MKKIAAFAAALFVLAGAAIAGAQTFDEESGTVTVMATGGTVHEDHTTTAQAVGGGATVASLTLPAGRYEVTAKTWVEDGSTAANFVQCGLTGLPVNENARSTIAASGSESLVVLGVVELEVEDDVELFCNADASATANLTVLQATTVSAIVAQ